MGTNYYVIKKKFAKEQNKIDKKLKKIEEDKLEVKIRNLILNEFKDVLELIPESSKERYEESLCEYVSDFVPGLYYNIKDEFNILERQKIHIGKNSAGWLFSFQDQENDECVWHNYNECMTWLKNNTRGKNATHIIIDEYGNQHSFTSLKKLIDEKQKDSIALSNPDNFRYCRNVDGYRFSSIEFS